MIKHQVNKDYYKKINKKGKPRKKPLVLCLFDQKRNCYYVLGTNGVDNGRGRGMFSKKKNTFGNRFNEAVEKAEIRYSHNSFESSMI